MIPIHKSKNTVVRDRENDIKFITSLRLMNLSDLEKALLNHSHDKTPRWKRIAIRRSISHFRFCTYEWILGLNELGPRLAHIETWKRFLILRTQERLRCTI